MEKPTEIYEVPAGLMEALIQYLLQKEPVLQLFLGLDAIKKIEKE